MNPAWTLFLVCGICYQGISALVRMAPNQIIQGGATPHLFPGNLSTNSRYVLAGTFPSPQLPQTPNHLLPEIKILYMQAFDNEKRKNWDSCGGICRKILDVSTALLGADKSKNLFNRIEELEGKRLLTPDLKEWAHAIRLDGNTALHDPTLFTEEEAIQIRSFTEIFLKYVYELPGMLDERKAKTAPPNP